VPSLAVLNHGYLPPADADHPAFEQTSTALWRSLAQHEFLPLLWAAFPFHPYGDRGPASNRTPNAAELAIGLPFLQKLLKQWQPQQLIAVGRVAERTLRGLGIPARHIRHPARGGAAQFDLGIASLARERGTIKSA
jgi:hypothetical protein